MSTHLLRDGGRAMGLAKISVVLVLLLAISLAEFDWLATVLTTPWWLLAAKICRLGGWQWLLDDPLGGLAAPW